MAMPFVSGANAHDDEFKTIIEWSCGFGFDDVKDAVPALPSFPFGYYVFVPCVDQIRNTACSLCGSGLFLICLTGCALCGSAFFV